MAQDGDIKNYLSKYQRDILIRICTKRLILLHGYKIAKYCDPQLTRV